MKTIGYVILLGMLTLVGCETRDYDLVTTVTKELEYNPDAVEGSFSETYTIYADDFNDDLGLDSDDTVKGVYIESLAISIEALEENVATAVNIDGYVSGVAFIEDGVFPIIEGSFDFTGITGLLNAGIDRMAQDLEGFVTDSDPPSMVFRIEGDSHPDPGQRIKLRIMINVTVSVIYSTQMEGI